MNILIRKAVSEDHKVVAETGRSTFYETWKEYNTEEDMKIYLDEAFSPEKIRKDIELSDVNTFYLAFLEGRPVGYAKFRNDRTYDEFKGEPAFEIERIYVYKAFQGAGVAHLLMEKALEQAAKENRKWIWLGVNVDNHRAIAFYKKYGFEIFGNKIFKLGNAEDPDYLMKRLV